MRLAIYPDGAVVVSAPRFFGIATIERFVMKHAEWVRRKVEATRGRTIRRIRRADIPDLKARAQALVRSRVQYFAARYGVSFRAIRIRAQKSRWGSCSRAGNLSFNYRIAALPAHIADYIVVHELCHLREMNHSKKFWDLVAQEIPDHKAVRKQLRNIVFMFENR